MDSYIDGLQLGSIPKYYQEKYLKKKKISDLHIKTADSIYSQLNITDEIAEKTNIRIFDESEKDNLILIHYILPYPEVKHIRGIVFDISVEGEPKMVVESFPYTDEIIVKGCINSEELREEEVSFKNPELPFILDKNIHSVTRAKEGTIIRVFKGSITDEWYLSTHKRLDSRKSKWSGPTFGKIFEEAWGGFEEYPLGDYLEDKICYVFLVRHPANRLVCEISEPQAGLVGVYNFVRKSSGDSESPDDQSDNHTEAEKLKKHHPKIEGQYSLSISSNEELFDIVKGINWKENQGIMVYNHVSAECYKLLNEQYFIKRGLRGNEPNLRLRYLQLRNDAEKRNELVELFSDRKEIFEDVELDLLALPKYLEKLYKNRYKKGDRSILPKEEHCLLEKTRQNYKPSISLKSNIRYFLENSNPLYVNGMIKNMKRDLRVIEQHKDSLPSTN